MKRSSLLSAAVLLSLSTSAFAAGNDFDLSVNNVLATVETLKAPPQGGFQPGHDNHSGDQHPGFDNHGGPNFPQPPMPRPGPGQHPGFPGGGPGNGPWPQPGVYQKCQDARVMEDLSRLAGSDISDEVGRFVQFICSFREDPVQTVRYPDGSYAFVGPEFADKGSWKYPSGKYAYVGEYYQDRQSWRYPNGNFAYVGPAYQDAQSWRYPNAAFAYTGPAYADKGSWRWPDGKFAYVGEYYQDRQSWRYPNGSFAYVGPAYSDAGSWKYPNGKYAFGGANVWYNPDGSLFPYGQQSEGIDTLTRIVEASYNTQFPYYSQLWGAPESLKTMFQLQWIEQTAGAAKAPVANKSPEQVSSALLEPGSVSIAPASASKCYSDRASTQCDQKVLSPLK